MKADLEKLVMENNRLLIESKDLIDEIKHHRIQEAALKKSNEQRSQHWMKEALVLKHSYSFRFGQIIINAFTKPGKNTILLPYYLVKLFRDIATGRGRDDLSEALKQNLGSPIF